MATKTYIQEKLTGLPGQVVSFDGSNKAIVKSLVPELGARIIATAPVGSVVTATDGISSVTATGEDQLFIPLGSDSFTTTNNDILYTEGGNTFVLQIPRIGSWSVTAETTAGSLSSMVSVSAAQDYYVDLSFFEALISVSYTSGAVCTCSNGTTTLTAADTSGSYTFSVSEPGTWTITASASGASRTTTVFIYESGQQENVTVDFVNNTLNNNTWAIIQSVAQEGTGSTYWSVGDRKSIVLNGTIGRLNLSSKTLYVFILGFDHNSALEGTGITFQLGKSALTGGTDICLVDANYQSSTTTSRYYTMNTSSTNVGGWASSQMRSNVCGTSLTSYTNTFIGAIPSDLRAVLKAVTKYSDNAGSRYNSPSLGAISATTEYVFLPSHFEVTGQVPYNYYEQQFQLQYFYYAAGNSTNKYNYNSTSTRVSWWLRSVNGSSSFAFMPASTVVGSTSTYSRGFAPCFVVG